MITLSRSSRQPQFALMLLSCYVGGNISSPSMSGGGGAHSAVFVAGSRLRLLARIATAGPVSTPQAMALRLVQLFLSISFPGEQVPALEAKVFEQTRLPPVLAFNSSDRQDDFS
jgi:hypothetical protein